tara:strand:- start:274 stop:414 length:141 start_codon:yes stop_codon:yes gene_type:complete
MTDQAHRISAALREAQLQRTEASLASKTGTKPQAKNDTSKDKPATI